MAPPPPASATYLEQAEGKRMAPPLSISASPIVNMVLRILTFIFLLAALIIITTNTFTYAGYYNEAVKVHFNDFYAYRYMLFTIITGVVYMLLQVAFAIYHLSMGKRLSLGLYTFDFYADKVISYTLATGAAATFGVTVDWKRTVSADSVGYDFYNKANASASLLLIAFVLSAISSIFSSLALSKRG